MSHPRHTHRIPLRLTAVSMCFFIALCASACGATASGSGDLNTSSTATTGPIITTTAAPMATHTPAGGCPYLSSEATTLTIPTPPNTVSYMSGGGAAGATFYFECTTNTTQAALVDSLNAAYQQAGWTRWDPAVDDAGGCGSEANDFWQWKNSQVVIGWTFHDLNPPAWMIAVCSLAYATPQA